MDERDFDVCWQAHEAALRIYARDLKMDSVGDAESLLARTEERARPAWPRFQDKGNKPFEYAWLKIIMLRLHLTDVRRRWRPSVSGDEPNPDGSGAFFDRLRDASPFAGSVEWLAQYDLEMTTSAIIQVMRENHADFNFSANDVAIWLRHRIEDVSLVELAATQKISLAQVREAIGKVDAVFRQLYVMMADSDSEDQERVAFDACFDSVLDTMEQAIENGVPRGVTLRNLVIFRGYYAHHEPTQQQVAIQFGLGGAPAVNHHLNNVRPRFCEYWRDACPDVRARLKGKWERLHVWKKEFLERWKTLTAISEAAIRAELEKAGVMEHLDAKARQEYEQTQREHEQVRLHRATYEEQHGLESLLDAKPRELFTRREHFCLKCDGVDVGQGQGRPGN